MGRETGKKTKDPGFEWVVSIWNLSLTEWGTKKTEGLYFGKMVVIKGKTWVMSDYLESELFFGDGMQLVRAMWF